MLTGKTSLEGESDSVLIFLKTEPFAQSLKKALESSGYRRTAMTSESVALTEANANVPSLIILDRRSGAVANFQRMSKLSTVPIVAVQEGHLSCHDDECLQEYDQGIDLVVYGQSVRELVARMRAILRHRVAGVESNIRYAAGNLRMDLDRHEVLVSGRAVELTPKEFQILRQFLDSPRRVFSRQEMLNRVWGEGYALEEHAWMCTFIRCGRRSSRNPATPTFLLTVRGVGYKLRA